MFSQWFFPRSLALFARLKIKVLWFFATAGFTHRAQHHMAEDHNIKQPYFT
jgi:hypothetical protein